MKRVFAGHSEIPYRSESSSAHFDQAQLTYSELEDKFMCPVCIATSAALVTGSASMGGLLAVSAKKLGERLKAVFSIKRIGTGHELPKQ